MDTKTLRNEITCIRLYHRKRWFHQPHIYLSMVTVLERLTEPNSGDGWWQGRAVCSLEHSCLWRGRPANAPPPEPPPPLPQRLNRYRNHMVHDRGTARRDPIRNLSALSHDSRRRRLVACRRSRLHGLVEQRPSAGAERPAQSAAVRQRVVAIDEGAHDPVECLRLVDGARRVGQVKRLCGAVLPVRGRHMPHCRIYNTTQPNRAHRDTGPN